MAKIWVELEEEPHGYFSMAAASRDKSTLVLSTEEMSKMQDAYKHVSIIYSTQQIVCTVQTHKLKKI